MTVSPDADRNAPQDDHGGGAEPPFYDDDDFAPTLSAEAPGASDLSLKTLGRYRILRNIDRGGQASVYLGEDPQIRGRYVALKVLKQGTSEGGLARFRREAEIAAQIGGEGICELLDGGTDGGIAWLAFKYIKGRTLAAIIAEAAMRNPLDSTEPRGPIDLTTKIRASDTEREANASQTLSRQRRIQATLTLLERIARIVARFHAADVHHRDLKPGNIMIRDDGQPIILDFGLAAVTSDDSGLTQTHDAMGTPNYMAPEHIRHGLAKAGARADVWALGVILQECLTGQRPFAAGSREAIFHAILNERPRPELRHEPGIPSEVATLVEIALEKNPTDRYQSAAALADDLRNILEQRPIRARPVSPRLRTWRFIQRHRAQAIAVAFAVFALIAGLSVSLAQLVRARAAIQDWRQLADLNRLHRLQDEALACGMMGPAGEGIERDAHRLWQRLPAHRAALQDLRKSRKATREFRENPRWQAQAENLKWVVNHMISREYDRSWAYTHAGRDDERIAYFDNNFRATLDHFSANARQIADSLQTSPMFEEHWVFEDFADQVQHDDLARLIAELSATADSEVSPFPPVVRMVGERKRRSEAEATIAPEQFERSWAEARSYALAHAPYAGLELTVTPRLLPLGPDPKSGLLEFACLWSGRPPMRLSDGSLDFKADSGHVFVLLPRGETTIGAWPQLPGHPREEHTDPALGFKLEPMPPVRQQFSAFAISKYETTKGQWLSTYPFARARQLPRQLSIMKGGTKVTVFSEDLLLPADSLDWFTARYYCSWLGMELPSSAQWEYAARGGRWASYPWGYDRAQSTRFANLRDDARSDGFGDLSPVGSFEPNPFGLHDIVGNLSEWTRELCDHTGRRVVARARVEEVEATLARIRGSNYRTEVSRASLAEVSAADAKTAVMTVGFRPIIKDWP